MDINKVTLIGRLTAKPEQRQASSGQASAQFSVATNYIWKDYKIKQRKDDTQFHNVVASGKLAEIVLQYLDKAARVYIEGRLHHHEWMDENDVKRTGTDIIADEIIMLGHRSK